MKYFLMDYVLCNTIWHLIARHGDRPGQHVSQAAGILYLELQFKIYIDENGVL